MMIPPPPRPAPARPDVAITEEGGDHKINAIEGGYGGADGTRRAPNQQLAHDSTRGDND